MVERSALGAGCRPLWQNSSAGGTAAVEAVGWGLKQGMQLVVPGCGASSALEGCPRTVYLGLAALAASTSCTGVGTVCCGWQC